MVLTFDYTLLFTCSITREYKYVTYIMIYAHNLVGSLWISMEIVMSFCGRATKLSLVKILAWDKTTAQELSFNNIPSGKKYRLPMHTCQNKKDFPLCSPGLLPHRLNSSE